jgi:hypothetical protein
MRLPSRKAFRVYSYRLPFTASPVHESEVRLLLGISLKYLTSKISERGLIHQAWFTGM